MGHSIAPLRRCRGIPLGEGNYTGRAYGSGEGTQLTGAAVRRLHLYVLWATIALYAFARVSQLYTNQLPVLFVVVLHVVPIAAFAAVYGSLVLGRKGILIRPVL